MHNILQESASSNPKNELVSPEVFEAIFPKDATETAKEDTGVFIPTKFWNQELFANLWFNHNASVLLLPLYALGLMIPDNYKIQEHA